MHIDCLNKPEIFDYFTSAYHDLVFIYVLVSYRTQNLAMENLYDLSALKYHVDTLPTFPRRFGEGPSSPFFSWRRVNLFEALHVVLRLSDFINT